MVEAGGRSREQPPRRRGGEGFGRGASRTLSDIELADVRHLVVEASRRARDLIEIFDAWHRSAELTVDTKRSPTDDHVEEIYLSSSAALPFRKMAILTAQSVHTARSALDHMNSVVMDKFATSEYDPRRVYFPVTESAKDWRSWRSRHSALPDWAVERYRALQPTSGPFKGLRGLQELDNLGKHRRLIPIRVAVVGSFGSRRTELESAEDPSLDVEVNATSNEFTRDQKRFLAATIRYPAAITNLTDASPSNLVVDPLVYFGDEHYTLREVADLPRRVDFAIDYIATGDPVHLSDYQQPFPDPLVRR